MKPKYKVDDTVRHKAGSVVMAIDNLKKRKTASGDAKNAVEEFDGHYECIWFIGGVAYFNTYHEDELTLVTSQAPS